MLIFVHNSLGETKPYGFLCPSSTYIIIIIIIILNPFIHYHLVQYTSRTTISVKAKRTDSEGGRNIDESLFWKINVISEAHTWKEFDCTVPVCTELNLLTIMMRDITLSSLHQVVIKGRREKCSRSSNRSLIGYDWIILRNEILLSWSLWMTGRIFIVIITHLGCYKVYSVQCMCRDLIEIQPYLS
jgi:hypothetical protein